MKDRLVSRLIGAPPGYVGFDQGGLLTDAIRKNPYTVLLMDEIEKAHPDVFNILLQVMDYATLTDNNGRKADFSHVVLLMTSNAGAFEMAGKSIGFSSTACEDKSERCMDAVEKLFSPEFRNRLDAIVSFHSLTPEIMSRIVDKLVAELNARMAEKRITVRLTDKARSLLAEQGYDNEFGARPLARLMEKEVEDPLADEMLFGKLAGGGKAVVDAPKASPRKAKGKHEGLGLVFSFE